MFAAMDGRNRARRRGVVAVASARPAARRQRRAAVEPCATHSVPAGKVEAEDEHAVAAEAKTILACGYYLFWSSWILIWTYFWRRSLWHSGSAKHPRWLMGMQPVDRHVASRHDVGDQSLCLQQRMEKV